MAAEDAPDEPPTGGFDRRQDLRREQDVIQSRMESWVGMLFTRKLLPLLAVAFVTWVGTTAANRIIWPSDDLKALDKKFSGRDSLMAIRVARLEDGQAMSVTRLAAIEEQLRFLGKLQCMGLRISNPTLAIDGCPVTKP